MKTAATSTLQLRTNLADSPVTMAVKDGRAPEEQSEPDVPKFTGGQILVKALFSQAVDRIYCVPGESYLPVLNALHDVPEIAVVSTRHEGASANMAEADGKLTGRPGICFVTRGPGATHASIGVHTAFQDSTPMILFIGQVALLTPPVPRQSLVHVHPDPTELGRVYQPVMAIPCGLSEFGTALCGIDIAGRERRAAWLREAREAYVRFSTPPPPASSPEYVDLAAVLAWLRDNLSDDAVVASGAGNYTVWVHRYFRYRHPRTELAPTSGAMGYGVPAAIAAKLRYPNREVVAFAGDGCFRMYPQEIGTAVQHHANLVIIVVNNGTYGTIRMHQERRYPGRVIATAILNPDFVALAHSYGAFAQRVETTERFPPAYLEAVASGRPAVLELRVDPDRLSPGSEV